MKKNSLKILVTMLMLTTFLTGCVSAKNTDSAATDSTNIQVEEETIQTETAEETTYVNESSTFREEMALVKSNGQIFIVIFGNYQEDYYMNASPSDEWKGDIKNIVSEMF